MRMSFTVLILLFTLILSACTSNDRDLDDAIKVAKEYKTIEYKADQPGPNAEISIEDIQAKQEAVKPLTTTVFYDQNVITRTYQNGFLIANYKQSKVEMNDLELTKKIQTDQEIELSYTGTLTFGNEHIDLHGDITMVKDTDTWKVNKDVYNFEEIVHILDEIISK
ncbi:hypothetical protein QPK24_04500 [Paenibacillus polygoni]|uniref:Lipoprotein n=1 Tax=Paenibacillus polygoni TaxID=3050112 RepID=A0ABY8X392_9BACL|nr:hypothetical protein [Paenibacillus polygoni]WIV19982.1 hypothetical protein QPK24_04500 [Paenibacillus polygoni]